MEVVLIRFVAIVVPMVVLDLLALSFGVDSRDGPGDNYRRPVGR